MREYRYLHVDVFTEVQFGGNQLAVYADSQGLSTEEMQKIALEMNFAETTFILPPEDNMADWKVRVFTPRQELPFSGHPTLGTAFVLAQEGMVPLQEPKTEIRLEMGIGIVPVTLDVKNKEIGFTQMNQPTPTFEKQSFTKIKSVTKALSLNESDIKDSEHPVEIVSGGAAFVFVPIKSIAAMEAIKPNDALIDEISDGADAVGFFVLSTDTINPESTLHTRVFLPHEDAATGFTSAALAYYVVTNEIVPADPTVKIVSEQGYEIGRPSTVYTEVDLTGMDITAVRIGGYTIPVAEGTLRIE